MEAPNIHPIMRYVLYLILTAFFLTMPLPAFQEETVSPTQPSQEAADPIQECLEHMTLRQKIGQLFMVTPESLLKSSEPVTYGNDSIKEALHTYPAGGIILFSENIKTQNQVSDLTKTLQDASPIPLFLCTDEEGGTVSRLANTPALNLPGLGNAGSVTDAETAIKRGLTIGAYMRTLGFNMDLAPVADVNTNPHNPVIGSRAFSKNPAQTAVLSRAMADGLSAEQIIPVFKHFPGHGDTAEDSHKQLAISHKSRQQLENCEWIPFQGAKKKDGIMVGHIAVPEMTGDNTPASMSPVLVKEILKKELGFEGLIITDALNMKAITQAYTPAEASLNALRAGCDVLLMPENFQEAFDGVLQAVKSGEYPEEELDRTVEKILRFKEEWGILNP